MDGRNYILMETRRKKSQEQSTLRRIRHTHHHRGNTWFALGALCVLISVVVLATQVVQSSPNHILIAVAIIVCILGALVVMDWWERA